LRFRWLALLCVSVDFFLCMLERCYEGDRSFKALRTAGRIISFVSGMMFTSFGCFRKRRLGAMVCITNFSFLVMFSVNLRNETSSPVSFVF
jgi:hypothetical protein